MAQSNSVRDAIMARLSEQGYKVDGEEKATPKKPSSPMFNAAVVETDGKKSYKDIIGEVHPDDPNSEKYFFTVYSKGDWDDEVKDLIPEVDANHFFDHDYALSVLMGIEYGKPVFAYGPPGSGKSVTPAQVCARINYPFMFIAGMGGTEPSDYVGCPWVKDGSMEWKDGPASYAVRHGAFLLYDEPFKASAQTNMCFQSLMDTRRELKLYGHPDPVKSSLKAHSKFRICLADNVRGLGDDMDKYAAEIQDQSTLNRTAYKVHVDYVPAKVEERLLAAKYPEATDTLIEYVVKLANLIRKGWKKGEVGMPYSVRDTQEFVEAALIHQCPAKAFSQTYYGYISDESEKKAVADMWKVVGFQGITL